VQGTVRWARGLEFGLLLDGQMPNLDELARQRNDDTHSTNPLDCANPPYKPLGGGSEKRA
jgi:hypothetical protein